MTAQALDMPLDIPWRRLAFSTDMVETRMDDHGLPPKWRSSMAVYAYVVPEEQTQDLHPDRRILYLKLTTSITGWCPREDLQNQVDLGAAPDPWQASGWEQIMGTAWAAKYWPCWGAVAQLAVYPNPAVDVALDDYPYIVDFEPKKRELYETVSATGEALSGSSNRVNTQKGTTTTNQTEQRLEVGTPNVPIVGPDLKFSISQGRSRQEIDSTTTDASTERRETQSHTTQFSQMYQLFNGYHLGTNRALFTVFPRPHIRSLLADENQTEVNLLTGARKLEGIQEMFLVVSTPRSLAGICVKAWLDTAHQVAAEAVTGAAPRAVVYFDPEVVANGHQPGEQDDDEKKDPPPQGPGSGGHGNDDESKQVILLTRRWVAGCGTFDRDVLVPAPVPPPTGHRPPGPLISGAFVLEPPGRSALQGSLSGATQDARALLADRLNDMQARVRDGILTAFSAGTLTPEPFTRSTALWTHLPQVLRGVDVELDQLINHGYLDAKHRAVLHKARINTTGDVFTAHGDARLDSEAAKIVSDLRSALLRGLWKRVKKPAATAGTK